MSDLGFQLISIVKEDYQLSNALNGLEYKLAYLLEEQLGASKLAVLNGESAGERLLKARNSKGLTQCELHELSGVSQETISRVENLNRELSYKVSVKLSKHLDVTPDFLMYGDD